MRRLTPFELRRKELFFLFFPDPQEISSRSLVHGEDYRRENQPIDVKVENKKKNKGGYSC